MVSRKWLLFKTKVRQKEYPSVFLGTFSERLHGSVARHLPFEITKSESSLIALYSLDTLRNIYILPNRTALQTAQTLFIFPVTDRHDKPSSVFYSLSCQLWALFKVLHIRVRDKTQRRKICGRASVSMVQVSDTTAVQWSFTHPFSSLVDHHLSPLVQNARHLPPPYSYTFKLNLDH